MPPIVDWRHVSAADFRVPADRRLSDLTAEQLATEGQIFRVQLERLRDEANTFLKMIEAAEETPAEAIV